MKLTIPESSLVVLIGPSGAGKSTFAARHFLPTEVISSDNCRGLVSDDENDLGATDDAFAVLQYIAGKRLGRKRLTVIDATSVQAWARRPLVGLARKYHVMPVAVVFDVDQAICLERNEARDDRDMPDRVVKKQLREMRAGIDDLYDEGFRMVHRLQSVEQIDSVELTRVPLFCDRREEAGPFDIIGDVHGCADELERLLAALGYESEPVDRGEGRYGLSWRHRQGRKAVFVGDLVDRGPRNLDALELAWEMVEQGAAVMVPGNHDEKFSRWLRGNPVRVAHGLERTIEEVESLPAEESQRFREDAASFIEDLTSHVVLDEGRLVVAHAGLKEEMHRGISEAVRDFALFGETTGATDEVGLPIRFDWARQYRGDAAVIYGHTPVESAQWVNNTLNIDTGCVFGGELTALRYPERELVQVPAAKTYVEPTRRVHGDEFGEAAAQHQVDDLLDVRDIAGKRRIHTELASKITIREGNATAAIEILSRFAVHPKWLIYLPPTMAPTHTSSREDYLEAPEEAFQYYAKRGVREVICEEKHMGSRAVVIVCRDEEAVQRRFGLRDEGIGVIYTRTGRRFFADSAREQGLLERIRQQLTETGFWKKFESDWACLDAELMPWSVKAQRLLQEQYAAVGAAAHHSLRRVAALAEEAAQRGTEMGEFQQQIKARRDRIDRYRDAYRQYCWEVDSLDDLLVAPFHLMATEQGVHIDKTHRWHMETLHHHLRCGEATSMHATRVFYVDPRDESAVAKATQWWEEMTAEGGEGMVVKPLDFVVRGDSGRVIQPALKCRGREYLRIIYGPEYTKPEYLRRLRKRNVGRKSSMALREFALGIEGLRRFVDGEPLRRVHECAFGVLALESDPVDPRL